MTKRAAQRLLDNIPKPYKRLQSAHNDTAKHFLALINKPQYRREQGTVMVQGYKTIKELKKQNVEIRSLIATAKPSINSISEDTSYPAKDILSDPNLLPAEKYYVTNVDLTRRILGTHSKPSNHEVYAEVKLPQPKAFVSIKSTEILGYTNANGATQKVGYDKNSNENIGVETTTTTKTATTTGFISSNTDKLLVLDGLNDPGNVGSLVRTAMGLGWKYGLVTLGTCDLYNNKAVRASRALSILWQFQVIPRQRLLATLLDNGYIPIAADMLPGAENQRDAGLCSMKDILNWDQEKQIKDMIKDKSNGSVASDKERLGGLLFHNFKSDIQSASLTRLLQNRKIALILSSEHHGVGQDSLLDNVIKVSVPMDPMVESLNVAAAGSIIMSQLSAFFPFLSLKDRT